MIMTVDSVTSPDLTESKKTEKASEALPLLIQLLCVSSTPTRCVQGGVNKHISPKAPQTDEPLIPLDVVSLIPTPLPSDAAISIAVIAVEVSSVFPEACAKSVLK